MNILNSTKKPGIEASADRTLNLNNETITEKIPENNKQGLTEVINKSDILCKIRDCPSSLNEIVDNWIAKYKRDREESLVELLGVFVSASGCNGVLTVDMFRDLKCSDLISKLSGTFDLDTAEYPIIANGNQWKKLRANLILFVLLIIEKCDQSIIFDQFLIRNVVSFLTGLSDSSIRPFRHTSTLILMKIMTGLVEVSVSLSKEAESASRQLDKENMKAGQRKQTDRVMTLKSRIKYIEEQLGEITDIKNYIFKHVFVHRYRDIVPDIRVICLTELGRWIFSNPDSFLTNDYLKYIGWSIYDRVGDIRLACMKLLQPLFGSAELGFGMEQFSSRFKERIILMAYDRDFEVAVQAIRTVTVMHKFDTCLFTLEECRMVFRLVFGVNRSVAHAAGEFLKGTIECRVEKERENSLILTKSGKNLSKNALYLYDAISYHIDTQYFDHTVYLVDSLFHCCPAITDWTTIIDLLLEEPVEPSHALCDQSESVLIEIMLFAVKQSCNSGVTHKKLSAKEMKQVELTRTSLSEIFVLNMSNLLSKFVADADKTANLLDILSHLDNSLFSQGEVASMQRLEEVLKLLEEILEKHVESTVLENCAKAYKALCSEPSITAICEESKNTIFGQLTDGLFVTYNNYFSHLGSSENDEFPLLSSVKKLFAFYCFHDLSAWNVTETVFSILKRARDSEVPPKVVVEAIRMAFLSVCWAYQSLKNSTILSEYVTVLRERIMELMTICEGLLEHVSDDVVEEAFLMFSDFLLLFGPGVQEEDEALHSLHMVPSVKLVDELTTFVETRVLTGDDDNCERKRLFLLAYCKLVLFGVIGFQYSIVVLVNYARCFSAFGDVIKLFISKLRGIDPILVARLIMASLGEFYKNMEAEDEPRLKELSKKFANFFGVSGKTARDSIVVIHQRGIKFALRSEGLELSNVSFFDVVSDFTSKVVPADRALILEYLDRQLLNLGVDYKEFSSLNKYRRSLMVSGFSVESSVKRRNDESDASVNKRDTTFVSSVVSTLPLNTPLVRMDSIAEADYGSLPDGDDSYVGSL